MTDLEQKLINELGKLAKQYAEDQERLSGQVERLEKQVQRLDESHIEAESRCRHCLEASLLLRKQSSSDGRAHRAIDHRLRNTTKLVQGR